jgi:hypothetical protein
MARPERRITKKVKDQSLIESVATQEESVIESPKSDSNVIDKGFYLDDKPIESLKETLDLSLEKVVIGIKEEAPLSQADIQAVQLEYRKKLESLEEENEKLRNERSSFSKNEVKLLNAIRIEGISQNTDWPIVSTNKLRKEYKVHPAYFSKSLSSLAALGMIKRKETAFSGKVITYKYKILK